jgi:hypothetical protein
MSDPRCSCLLTTSPSGEPVRYLDAMCPEHGRTATREPPHCSTCTCGMGAPIAQTPTVAREMAQRAKAEKEREK